MRFAGLLPDRYLHDFRSGYGAFLHLSGLLSVFMINAAAIPAKKVREFGPSFLCGGICDISTIGKQSMKG